MFKSKTRPVVYTQYEHGRLAGTLAQLWGNEAFDRPALDFPAFVDGVALHDWAYQFCDDLPIGEADEDAWQAIMRRGVANRYGHPTTDIVVRLHIRRLLMLYPSPEREALVGQIDHQVRTMLEANGYSRELFERTDKLTQLCDMISFDFCFELPRQRTLQVFPRQQSSELTDITYEIKPPGQVLVSPWPFSVPAIHGIVYAFKREGFPETLDPFAAPFTILPG